MSTYKCPDCAANMTLIDNFDGTGFYRCEYCGKSIPVRIQRPQISKDPAFNAMIQDLQRRITAADGKEKAKLEKKLAKELQYRANLHLD